MVGMSGIAHTDLPGTFKRARLAFRVILNVCSWVLY